MRRPWIYVVGPHSGENITEVFEHCRYARDVAREIWEAGAAAFCPHLNSLFLDACASHNDFVQAYIQIMLKMDAVVVLNGWRGSKGSRQEVKAAQKAKLPIYYNDWQEDIGLKPWIEKLCENHA